MESVGQGFGNALALVVAGAGTDGVDMSPAGKWKGQINTPTRVEGVLLTSPRVEGALRGHRKPLMTRKLV